MHNVRYDYSSVHVDVPLPLSGQITEWGKKHIPDEEITINYTDGSLGRENEIHVTILYGITTDNSAIIQKIVEKERSVKVKLGQVQVFTNSDSFDVVVIEAISHDLERLNRKLRQVPFQNKYIEYQPHITIGYVKKGKGWKHFGLNEFIDQEFTCDYIIFSSSNGNKKRIELNQV